MKNLFSATAMITLAAFAAPAFAQDAADQGAVDDSGIGAIVVTAQKRQENVQDVPIAISAVSTAFLESRGIDSIDKLGTIAPNVKIERAPSSKTISQIAIRGSVTINPAIIWEPAVGLYLDGVYIAKAQGSIFDVADLERVEVLRGPQGTLYGRNALAGAVNLITKKPSGELGGLAEVTYGSFNEWKFRGVLDLPQTGIFSAKVSGQYRRRDGLIDLVAPQAPQTPLGLNTQAAVAPTAQSGKTDSIKNGSFMVQVRADLSDNLVADYTFDYTKADQTPPFSQLLSVNKNGDPRDIFDPASASRPYGHDLFPIQGQANPNRSTSAQIDAPVFEKSRSYGHALTLSLDLGSATLKSISAYRNLNWGDLLDLDGTAYSVAQTERKTQYESWSQELQLTGEAFADRLSYVLGAFYFDETAATQNPQTYFGGSFLETVLDSDYGIKTKAFALYAQGDYKLTEALKLTVGARYTYEKKKASRYFEAISDPEHGIFAPQVIANLPYGVIPAKEYNDFSPAITLSYEVAPEINTYARFAKGFKSGGFNAETNVFAFKNTGFPGFDGQVTEACPSGATELCEPYKPEKVDSYEVGIKTRLLDNRVMFNVAAFRDEHKDIQLSIFTASTGASSVVRNAAQARIQGLEFETVLRPIDSITINASLAILDSKYKRYMDGVNDVSRNRAFPHAPKVTAAAGVDWKVVEGDWGKLNLYGDINYVSKYYTYPYALTSANASDQVAGTTRSNGRTIVNLRATVADIQLGGGKTLDVSGFVRNLTKEADPSNFIDFGPKFGGINLGYFPEPRTFGVTAGIKF